MMMVSNGLVQNSDDICLLLGQTLNITNNNVI